MVAREQLDPNASLWDWIAVDLRFWRIKRGQSTSEVGRFLKINRHQVSNLEAGRRKLQDDQAEKLDQLWDLNGHFGRLLLYARAGHDPDWFQQHLHLESLASELRIWEPMRVPGLLQNEGYARFVIHADGAPDPEQAVKLRLSRQSMLHRKAPPWVWVLLDEQVILRPTGGSATMVGQLAHLLDISDHPHITVQVVPVSAGWNAGLDGAFKIMNVKGQMYAYSEAAEGGRLVLSATDVQGFALRYDQIRAQAMPVGLSREMIKRSMESMS